MFVELLRSVATGLIIGAILLVAMPSPCSLNPLSAPRLDSTNETPANYSLTTRRAAPAVVNVYNRGSNTSSHNRLEIHTLGFGVIIDQRGYIITDKYVINDANQIIAALQDGCVFEALLVGSDFPIDLAMLRINATDGLPMIPINPHHVPRIGDVVLAIGNPYNLEQTVTQGIISAMGRIGLNPTGQRGSLQTNASISHGNSDGALTNSLGELMGINTLSLDKGNDGETPEGIGFTIPSQSAIEIMDKLIRDGRVIRDYIGIGGREIALLHAQSGGMDQLQRTVVSEVSSDGPAANVGVQANSLTISVNDKPAVLAPETMGQVMEICLGSVIPVVVIRGDKQLALQVTIQGYPATN